MHVKRSLFHKRPTQWGNVLWASLIKQAPYLQTCLFIYQLLLLLFFLWYEMSYHAKKGLYFYISASSMRRYVFQRTTFPGMITKIKVFSCYSRTSVSLLTDFNKHLQKFWYKILFLSEYVNAISKFNQTGGCSVMFHSSSDLQWVCILRSKL